MQPLAIGTASSASLWRSRSRSRLGGRFPGESEAGRRGARPGATARCITSRPAGAANSGERGRSGRHGGADSVGLHERRMPAGGFRTGVAAGRDAMREHRAGSPRREPVGATGQGPNVASASDALPSVLLPDAPEKRTAGLTARPGVGALALERDLADDAMRQQSPRRTCEKHDGPHTPGAVFRWFPRLPYEALPAPLAPCRELHSVPVIQPQGPRTIPDRYPCPPPSNDPGRNVRERTIPTPGCPPNEPAA